MDSGTALKLGMFSALVVRRDRLIVVLGGLWPCIAALRLPRIMPKPKKPLLVTSSPAPVGEVDERFLSLCLDLGQIAEPTRFWNPDGSGEIVEGPPFDFTRPQLINMTAELAPCYLRIGGTEADRVFYALDEDEPPPKTPPRPYKSTLHRRAVDAIGQFATATGATVCFTLNAGRGARGATGVWQSAQARALMRYAREQKLPFEVYELGNEPNAWPLFHDKLLVQPEQYARDLHELAAARDAEAPGARIAGPATAYAAQVGTAIRRGGLTTARTLPTQVLARAAQRRGASARALSAAQAGPWLPAPRARGLCQADAARHRHVALLPGALNEVRVAATFRGAAPSAASRSASLSVEHGKRRSSAGLDSAPSAPPSAPHSRGSSARSQSSHTRSPASQTSGCASGTAGTSTQSFGEVYL